MISVVSPQATLTASRPRDNRRHSSIALENALNELFARVPRLDVQLIERLADWLAFHVSNFGFSLAPFERPWAEAVEIPVTMDEDGSGEVDFEEFIGWWKNKVREDLVLSCLAIHLEIQQSSDHLWCRDKLGGTTSRRNVENR